MKKNITILLFAALFFVFTSCNKCVTCTYDSEQTAAEEICEADYSTQAEYDFIIGVSETFGAKCE